MKHKFTKILLAFTAVLSLFSISSAPVFADGKYFRDDECNGSFLGLVSWCYNIGDFQNEEELKSGIWKIAANIAIDITVIAAYLVLFFVIYGGYLYSLSGGDPSKVANGKKTIANAFIGLAIVLTANIILNTIRFALIGSEGNLSQCYSENGCVTPTDMIANAIQWVIGIAGVVSAIFVVFGGISYVTSSGDPNKTQKARQMILYALIGLAIVALAEVLTAFVTNIIKDANKSAAQTSASYQITNQISSKEVHVPKIL